MDGGAIIGHGTFGCVFDPPLRVVSKVDGKCVNVNTTGRTVGKISESEEVSNEIEAAKVLTTIPNYSSYFSVVDLNNIHRPCKKSLQTDAGLDECPIIKRVNMSNMLHFTMPYSGIGLSKYFTIHIKNKKQVPISKTITHILEAGSLLILNNFIHYDIHSENILFDDVTSIPRIIDFGFSFSVTNINKDTLDTRWKVYSPDYPTEAPEITAIQGVRHKMSLNTVINQIMTGKHPIKMAQFILGIPMIKQEKSFRSFWENSKSIQESDWVSFFKYYWPGFDAWSFGTVILKIYSHVSQAPVYTKDPSWAQISLKIKAILRGLLQVNPIERIDCIEALYMFHPESPIFKLEAATSWLEEKERFRKPIAT